MRKGREISQFDSKSSLPCQVPMAPLRASEQPEPETRKGDEKALMHLCSMQCARLRLFGNSSGPLGLGLGFRSWGLGCLC